MARTKEMVASAIREGKMVPVGTYRVRLYANKLDKDSGETYKIVCFVAPSGWGKEREPIKTRDEAIGIALDNSRRLLRVGTDVIDIQIEAVPSDSPNPD